MITYRKWTALIISVLTLIVLLCGCSINNLGQTKEQTSQNSTVSKEEQHLDENYFPKDKIVDVKITIDEEQFQEILDNPTAEENKEATIDYNGHVFENIGIRTKGNSSLSSVARMEDSERYSFKLSLDEYVSQNMEGITKINLNNGYSDNSYMREFLAYEIAESLGIPTPKYSFVNVYVNDELWGLYTAVEQMNESFVEREFGSTAGTLYKSNGGTGADLTSLDTFDEYTGLDVKLGNANKEALLAMTEALNHGSEQDILETLDVEMALKFIALNTVIANMDSYAGNFKHNYYLYEEDGKFSIIPWDLNMAFGGFGGTGILIDEPTAVALNTRPLIDKLLAIDSFKEQYHTIIGQLIEQSFSGTTFSDRVAEIKQLIGDAVANDPTAFVTYEQFETGVTELNQFVNTQIDSINKQLSGEIATYGDGSGTASGGMGGMGNMRGNRGGMNANGANAEFQGMPDGMAPPDGMNADQQFPQWNQDGMRPGPGAPGDFQMPGVSSNDTTFNEEAAMKEATYSFIAMILLVISILFIVFYKRKRL